MSGTFIINDASVWMPAGDVYDGVLKKIADLLPQENAGLRDLLMNSRTDMSVGYCDLRPLDNAEFMAVMQAATAAYAQFISAGPKSFAMPEFYPGYMNQMKLLLGMLKSDPRVVKVAG